MNKTEIINKIKNTYPDKFQNEEALNEQVEKLLSSTQEVKNALFKFLTDGELDLLEVEGYTTKSLVEEYGMTEIGALTTITWLQREPDVAKEALKRGFDYVSA